MREAKTMCVLFHRFAAAGRPLGTTPPAAAGKPRQSSLKGTALVILLLRLLRRGPAAKVSNLAV